MLTDRPVPPDWMPTGGYPAFYRISGHLWARGLWLDQHSNPTALAAMACTSYASNALQAVPPDRLEEYRSSALELLAELGWLPVRRSHLSLVRTDGYDIDLIEICKPLGD